MIKIIEKRELDLVLPKVSSGRVRNNSRGLNQSFSPCSSRNRPGA